MRSHNRYHSPNTSGSFGYVDLLTFTVKKEMEAKRRPQMGVGEDFSFKGIDFVKENHIKIVKNIYMPNPLAFIYLKMTPYPESTDRRSKDFVDIFESVVGIIQKGTIFDEIKGIIGTSALKENIDEIMKMLKGVSDDSSTKWDYELVENQILQRDTLADYSHEEIKTFFGLFLSELSL
jgi:hypothetical protein